MKWVAAVLVLCLLGACGHRSVVDASIAKLDDSGRFSTSARAAQTVADISTQLRLSGAACRPRHTPRCTVLLEAAAYSAVTAYTLADCTSPGVYDGRTAMRRYLHSVRAYFHGAKKPSVPEVITC